MYVYAFCKAPASPLSLPDGIAGPLELVICDQLAALVEPNLSLEALPQDDAALVQAILTHDRILQALFQEIPLLPLRFGTSFATPASIVEHLAAESLRYLAKLTQLEQKAEYVLKVVRLDEPEPSMPAPATGKDYFLAKKQQYQLQQLRQQQQAAELQQALLAINRLQAIGLIEQIHPWPPAAATDSLTLYLLAHQGHATRLRQQIDQCQQTYQHWQFSLEGAFPPYHFLGE